MIRLLFTFALAATCTAAPVHLVDEAPVSITRVKPGVILIDFGRVSFGNIHLTPPAGANHPVAVHFGEDFKDGRINRKPPGTVRYAMTKLHLKGSGPLRAAPPADERNTTTDRPGTPPAVLTPPEWGVVLPFRWVEIEGWPGELSPKNITRKSASASTWDDQAAAFKSSDAMLNRIWELCRYSIKATTFAGVYVDGDRERIPYEADAYTKGKIPTPLGPIEVGWENKSFFQMRLALPVGMTAKLELPASPASRGVSINAEPVTAKRIGARWHVDEVVSGSASVVVE